MGDVKRKIKGDYSFAMQQLLIDLVGLKNGKHNKSISGILIDWDSNRGNDWFTDTLKYEEERDLNNLEELRNKYEQRD
jgi:hypothetical protein